MANAPERNAERWTLFGISGFMILCLIFTQIGHQLSTDLREGQERLAKAIDDTKQAMKDPNFYALIITNDGVVSDSKNTEKKLANVETAIKEVDRDADELQRRIKFFDSAIVSFSALTMMIAISMMVRVWKLSRCKDS
jgi:ABC-type transport system involved in cytochrome bd biosynthesis fused ATPase/permease subunit